MTKKLRHREIQNLSQVTQLVSHEPVIKAVKAVEEEGSCFTLEYCPLLVQILLTLDLYTFFPGLVTYFLKIHFVVV